MIITFRRGQNRRGISNNLGTAILFLIQERAQAFLRGISMESYNLGKLGRVVK